MDKLGADVVQKPLQRFQCPKITVEHFNDKLCPRWGIWGLLKGTSMKTQDIFPLICCIEKAFRNVLRVHVTPSRQLDLNRICKGEHEEIQEWLRSLEERRNWHRDSSYVPVEGNDYGILEQRQGLFSEKTRISLDRSENLKGGEKRESHQVVPQFSSWGFVVLSHPLGTFSGLHPSTHSVY